MSPLLEVLEHRTKYSGQTCVFGEYVDKADRGVKVERGIPEAPSRTLCFCLTPKLRGLAVDLGQTNCAGTWLLADQNGMKCVVTEYKLSPQAHYARLLCYINLTTDV